VQTGRRDKEERGEEKETFVRKDSREVQCILMHEYGGRKMEEVATYPTRKSVDQLHGSVAYGEYNAKGQQ
jgi:hypothetical protein